MTGSGMGCPDWPKCFGSWIPPTHVSDLPDNYKEVYAHRGYDKIDFNVFNTWAEYINRLLGLVGGICCLILLVLSVFTKHPLLIILSLLLLFLMIFQAWMGALVVYSILAPFKITIHMMIALLILCLLFFLFRVSSVHNYSIKSLSPWIWIALVISFLQIILGTQVRESIDALLQIFSRDSIINQLPIIFEVHRSLAWLVLFSNTILLFINRKVIFHFIEFQIIIMSLGFLIASGIIMSYYYLVGLAQLIHLVSAVALCISQYSLILKAIVNPISKTP